MDTNIQEPFAGDPFDHAAPLPIPAETNWRADYRLDIATMSDRSTSWLPAFLSFVVWSGRTRSQLWPVGSS
jgi:hypothetical protein